MTNGQITVDSDAPFLKGGLSIGLRLQELQEAAFATCINITFRMTAKEKTLNWSMFPPSVTLTDMIKRQFSNTKLPLTINYAGPIGGF